MKKCEEIVELNRIDRCRSQAVRWPTIKISSTCIGVPPINPPINPPGISIIPTVKRYFYVPAAHINLANGTTIQATQFYNDDGSPTTEFMSFSPNGYSDLYINAVIQEGGMYVVHTDSLTINPVNSIIYAGTPIILKLVTFSASLQS